MTILAATVTLAAAAGAPLPAAGAPPLASPPTMALLACSTGLTPGERTAVFEGRMSRVPGTRRMQMRFTLQSHRGAGERWTAVAGPGLGAWVSSDPGVTRYTFTKRIENLSVPAAYRMAVRFRWLDAGARSIRTGRAISKLCHEPDLRPQLVPGRINVAGIGDPARRRYVVTVRNRGRTAAGPFDVALDAPAPLPAGHVVDLGPGATTLVAFEGPRCQPGATLTATVDPTGFVDEADENDNTLAVPCPPAAR